MTRPLPADARKILVAGTSGAGKSTLARQLAAVCGYPYTEIDSLFHGPDWQPRPAFISDVDTFSSGPAWVTEWQYSTVRPLLAERADTLIWLDHPRWLVMYRVTLRTTRRFLTRAELWNGNREPGLLHALFHREGIIRWAWCTYERNRQLIASLADSHPQLRIIRLTGAGAVRQWLAASASTRAGSGGILRR